MTPPVVVIGEPAERALVSDGAEVGGVRVGSAADWAPERAGGAPRLLVAVGGAHVTASGAANVPAAAGEAADPAAADEADVLAAAEEAVTIRWLAGASPSDAAVGERVIAQGGEGLWRRAPWPVGDDLFALAPAPSTPHVLVLGQGGSRRAAVADALAARNVSAQAIERLDRQRLETASALVWLGAPERPVPAWLMAPLAARRVLIVAGRLADFGLQPGVDHLSAFDDDEAIALAAAVAARPDTLSALLFFGRRAAEHHRASRVFTRLLGDLERERPPAGPS